MNPDLYLIGLSVTVAVIGATLAFSFGDAVVKSLMRRRFNRWLSRQEFDVAVPVIPSLGGPEMMVVKNGRCWCVWFTDHPTKKQFSTISKLRDKHFRCVASSTLSYIQKDFIQWQ